MDRDTQTILFFGALLILAVVVVIFAQRRYKKRFSDAIEFGKRNNLISDTDIIATAAQMGSVKENIAKTAAWAMIGVLRRVKQNIVVIGLNRILIVFFEDGIEKGFANATIIQKSDIERTEIMSKMAAVKVALMLKDGQHIQFLLNSVNRKVTSRQTIAESFNLNNNSGIKE
jgi:hypothetical protein